MPNDTTTIESLANELDLPVNELVKFIRFIREDREMRPYIRKGIKPSTPLTASQADHIRDLDRKGRELAD